MLKRDGEPVVVNNADIENALSAGYTFRPNRAMVQGLERSRDTEHRGEAAGARNRRLSGMTEAEHRRQTQALDEEEARRQRVAEIDEQHWREELEERLAAEEANILGFNPGERVNMLNHEGTPVTVDGADVKEALGAGYRFPPNRAMMQDDDERSGPRRTEIRSDASMKGLLMINARGEGVVVPWSEVSYALWRGYSLPPEVPNVSPLSEKALDYLLQR